MMPGMHAVEDVCRMPGVHAVEDMCRMPGKMEHCNYFYCCC
jgi:hypothetical protein